MSAMVPFRGQRSLMNRDASTLWEDAFFRPFFEMGNWFGSSSFRVDVKDQGDRYELQAEMPGVRKEDIQLSIDNGMLTIAADFNHQQKEEKDNYVYSERRSGRFQRSFSLDGIEEDAIRAQYRDGILTVQLPKTKVEEKPEARTIAIDDWSALCM